MNSQIALPMAMPSRSRVWPFQLAFLPINMVTRLIVWVSIATGAIRMDSRMSTMTPRVIRAAPPKPMRRAGSAIAQRMARILGPNSSTAVTPSKAPDGSTCAGGQYPLAAPPSTTSINASHMGDVQ